MREKNIRIAVREVDGNTEKVRLNYNRCNLYYNDSDGSFRVQPYDDTHNEFYDVKLGKHTYLLTHEETSVDHIRPFTDIIDAVKDMYGSKDFNHKRVSLLWSAYNGNHTLFESNHSQYFFPIDKDNHGEV